MSRFHEYLDIDRWEDYREENGSGTGGFIYTLPDYRFERLFKEVQSLKAENEKLRKCVKFYASEYSWITKMIGVCDLIHEDDLEQLQDSRGIDWNIGGKFARQTLKGLK